MFKWIGTALSVTLTGCGGDPTMSVITFPLQSKSLLEQ